MRLNAKNVAGLALPAGKNDVIHFDDAMPGFGFRLRRRGPTDPVRSSWVVQYRSHGDTRRHKIGDAEVLDAEAARAAARKLLAQIALGQDPQDERHRDKDRFRNIVSEYLSAKQKELRPATLAKVCAYLAGAYFRPLHNQPIDAITRKQIAGCLVTIVRERGPMAGLRARDALHALFTWSLTMGLAEKNPVIGAFTPKPNPSRERTLSEAELTAVWCAAVKDDSDYGRILRLLILTGCRRQEIGGMCWSEFDPANGTWTLPAERSKNHRAHTLALPAAAWEIIDSVPRMAGRDQLFGVHAGRGFSAWHQAKVSMDRRLGDGAAPFLVHDLRRTVATGMAEIGVQPHIIEQVLNHQSGHKKGVAGIYNRSSYAREVKAALGLWADHVRALVEGGGRKVVPFRANSALDPPDSGH